MKLMNTVAWKWRHRLIYVT